MDFEMKEDEVGIFTKGRERLARDAKDAAHKAWHVFGLQDGRKRQWFERDGMSLAEARAELAAKLALPSDPETGELVDTTAIRAKIEGLVPIVEKRRLEAEASAAQLAVLAEAKDKAAIAYAEVAFDVEHLEPFAKQLILLHEMNKKLAEAQSKLLSRPQFALSLLTDDLLAGWMREKDARCNPPAAREVDWNTVITFIKPYSPGGLSGVRYNPDEGAAFAPEKASEIVASGFARFTKSTPENEAAVKRAKQRLSQIDKYANVLTSVAGGNE